MISQLEGAGSDCGKLRRDQAAREAGMTPTRLSRHLRARTGFGFRSWRLGIRLQIAVRVLADTDDQIKYIADIAGFAGPTGGTTQFDRCFREVFSIAPLRFRSLLNDLRLR